MNKDEFLQRLQEALSGEVPPTVVYENLQYYSRYVRDERQKGRREQEVLEELGDPRLIARTIIDTTPGTGEGGFEEYHDSFPFGGYGFDTDDSPTADSQADEDNWSDSHGRVRYYDLNKWYWKLLGVTIVICFFVAIVAVISGLVVLLVPLLPIIVAIAIILWFVRRY